MARLALLLTLLIQARHVLTTTCYTPSGVDRNSLTDPPNMGVYLPCRPHANVSMCCAIGGTDASSNDICEPRGICYNPSTQTYYRESCTDPTWQDPACIKLFMNALRDVPITKCDDGSWCEGAANTTCCVAGKGVFIVANGSQTTQNSSSGTDDDNDRKSYPAAVLTPGGKAGVAFGLLLGVPLIIFIFIGLYPRQKLPRPLQSLHSAFQRGANCISRRRTLDGQKAHGQIAPVLQAERHREKAELPAMSCRDKNVVYERFELPGTEADLERAELPNNEQRFVIPPASTAVQNWI